MRQCNSFFGKDNLKASLSVIAKEYKNGGSLSETLSISQNNSY